MSARQDYIHNQHDHSYKEFFSHVEMVRDLLKGFVPLDWLDQLDDSSWEKVNGHFVTHNFRTRGDDVIWKVCLVDHSICIYLIIEFQSVIDNSMPVRFPAYACLLWQDLIKSKKISPKGPLPLILPIVLYNGGQRWNASLDLQSMLQPRPAGLEEYQPQMRYLLIDEGAYDDNKLKPMRNLVAALVRLENSRTWQEVDEVLGILCVWLDAPEYISLQRAFAVWIGRVIMRKFPGGAIEGVYNLLEMRTMLSERVGEWAEVWKKEGLQKGLQQGLEQGLQQGLQKGRREGEIELLSRLLSRRFGALPEWVVSRMHQAELRQLEVWSDRLFDITSLEDLFDSHS